MDQYLYHIQKIHEKELLKKRNVVSVGIGKKYKNGQPTDKTCIVVGVSKKEDLIYLNSADIIPSSLQNAETDVFELGEIKAQNEEDIDPTQRIRPVRPGSSTGHHAITAGTIGCVVKKGHEFFLLSNNHVFSNSNDAMVGQAILQPGAYDGGHMGDVIAELYDWEPIYFEGEEIPPDQEPPEEEPPIEPPSPPEEKKKSNCPIVNVITRSLNLAAKTVNSKTVLVPLRIEIQDTDNLMDAAIAKPVVQVDKNIIQIGMPTGIKEPEIDLEVKKYGRTTKLTTGTVKQTNATVKVNYGNGKEAIFIDQIVTTAMSQGGDSGSLVLTEDNRAVGLLFAGSNSSTIISPIKKVLDRFKVTLETV